MIHNFIITLPFSIYLTVVGFIISEDVTHWLEIHTLLDDTTTTCGGIGDAICGAGY